MKPIHIERMNGEFLLNYSDFSFFVNRNGWRARPDWKISWEGNPNAFALSYPYILAFEPNFIEIRHIETSELIHIMTGKNIRMLHSSTREVCSYFPHYHPIEWIANTISDFVRLRRRRRRGCSSQSGFLEQAATTLSHLNDWCNQKKAFVLCHYVFLSPVESRLIIHQAFDSHFHQLLPLEFFKEYRSALRS